MNATYTVHVPEGHVALISFPAFNLKWDFLTKRKGYVELASLHANGGLTLIWRHSIPRSILPRVFHTPVRIRLYVPLGDALTRGFQMAFSVHLLSQTPLQFSNGTFNCSVPFYHNFQVHFDCNMVPQCVGGEDEGSHCPFSNEACKGKIVAGNKCYFHIQMEYLFSWRRARKECHAEGGNLATLKTTAEIEVFRQLLKIKNLFNPVYVGLQSFHSSMPRFYVKSHVWADNTVNYHSNTRFGMWSNFYGRICFVFEPSRFNDQLKSWLTYVPCNVMEFRDFVCQNEVKKASKPVLTFPKLNKAFDYHSLKQSLTLCPKGHMTHTILSCDPHSQCGATRYALKCQKFDTIGVISSNSIPMFLCENSKETVHYTLLCDFHEDCEDKSDEALCVHDTFCIDFACRNGQCISKSDECNGVIDCWDGSDEACSFHFSHIQHISIHKPPPTHITFLGDGTVVHTKITDCGSCPLTHTCCSEGTCIPVYCRCNGLGDCVNHEDEDRCEHFQCPGFYRCWSSSVCVHTNHLCDGWPQCPRHDDEWLCNSWCPIGCLCQGHAFRCLYPVRLTPFPLLRFLDASGSGMGLHDVRDMMYLIKATFSNCGLNDTSRQTLLNLLSLDLSHNKLSSVNMAAFQSLLRLKYLNLSNNPLECLFSEVSVVKHTYLVSLDISHSLLTVFNSTALVNYPNLRHLDLSHSTITDISKDGFSSVPSLEKIELQGNDIRHYPTDIFQHLKELHTIISGQYKLCCKDVLPQDFDERNCLAPNDEVSSCADLLRSDAYRAFLWLFCVLSIVGNFGCLFTRMFLIKGKSVMAFSIFVNNLSIADLVMGVYLGIVGTADHVYRGKYIWFEESWKPSQACQLAGVLSLLSSETSALIICLITLDRILVLRFPFGHFHFKRLSATVVCFQVWLIGFGLASAPLLPVTSQWNFYSQTGLCIPLPINRHAFGGRDYAFGIMIIFNLVLFVLIASGQVIIYWTIRTTSAVQSTAKSTKDLTIARRLLSVMVSDFLCWFPIGLLGILAATGTPVPGEVNVGMAIFVLPLNAALNPFLYTFNALMEVWNKKEEDRLLKHLENGSL